MRPESSLTATSKPTIGAGAPVGAELPAEAGLVVVPVDRPGQPESEAWELLLNRADHRCDRLAAVGDGQRVDVAGFLGVELVDGGSAGARIRLVPGVDVALREFVMSSHGCNPRGGAACCRLPGR